MAGKIPRNSDAELTKREKQSAIFVRLRALDLFAGVNHSILPVCKSARRRRDVTNTTGYRKTDQLRIVGPVETAAAFAHDVLRPGGTFLAKTFQSGADAELLAELKRDFATVRHVKPAASRQDSSERYVLATGFRR